MTRPARIPDVGQRLAAARLRRGITQSEAARRAGVAPSYLSRIETGKVRPSFAAAMRIARALGASPEEVVGTEESASRAQGPCPVTHKGQCLLDLIGASSESGGYSPREIRLLRRFAAWLEGADATRLRAMEVLLEDLTPK